jgi:hypothetical protein
MVSRKWLEFESSVISSLLKQADSALERLLEITPWERITRNSWPMRPMRLMAWFPGWNSIEGSGWWSNFHFWFGIACLLLLGASEVLSHLYGLRKEALTEAQSTAQVANLQMQLADSGARVAELQKYETQRQLSPSEKKALVMALAPFRGQKASIASILGDAEGNQYANDFVAVLEQAGWDHHGDNGISFNQFSVEPVGIEIAVHQVNERQGEAIPAALALAETLKQMNLLGGGGLRISAGVPPSETQIRVGRKSLQRN